MFEMLALLPLVLVLVFLFLVRRATVAALSSVKTRDRKTLVKVRPGSVGTGSQHGLRRADYEQRQIVGRRGRRVAREEIATLLQKCWSSEESETRN